jgi:hypothetical protein
MCLRSGYLQFTTGSLAVKTKGRIKINTYRDPYKEEEDDHACSELMSSIILPMRQMEKGYPAQRLRRRHVGEANILWPVPTYPIKSVLCLGMFIGRPTCSTPATMSAFLLGGQLALLPQRCRTCLPGGKVGWFQWIGFSRHRCLLITGAQQ